MTKQKIPYAILFLSVAALLLAGSILASQYLIPSLPQEPTQLENPTDPPPTEPPFTIDSIRTETFYDIPSGSAAYDTACYMLYYDIMDAENGQFFELKKGYFAVFFPQDAHAPCRKNDSADTAHKLVFKVKL